MNITKLSKDEILLAVKKDIADRTKEGIVKLQTFYFKIVTQDTIRTSSFRYFHAKTALEYLSDQLGDIETLNNLKTYHTNKVNFEIANPVKKDDEYVKPIKENAATKADKNKPLVGRAIQVDLTKLKNI